MTIEFQGYTPGTEPDGCEIYEYGFTSSCVDPNSGENRGFTQEWYYDNEIGAWIAISIGGGGAADFDNAGPTYTSDSHSAPVIEGTGNIRKFAFLDPDTGALTFDYVNTYDLLNPNERSFTLVHGPSDWGGLINGQAGLVKQSTLGIGNGNDGVTLCSDSSLIRQISQDSSSLGIRFYCNGQNPSSFSPLPVGVTLSHIASGTTRVVYSASDGDAVTATDLPLFYDSGLGLVNGQNDLERNEFYLGFTSNGPTYRAMRLRMDAIADDTSTDSATTTQAVSTENNYYVVVLGTDTDINTITGNDILNAANGTTSGYRFLMCPTNSSTNRKTKRSLSKSQLGGEESGSEITIHLAFPLRSAIIPGEHLYWDPGTPSAPQNPTGFDNIPGESSRTLDITNDFGYVETYNVFRAQQLGVSDNGLKIDTTS